MFTKSSKSFGILSFLLIALLCLAGGMIWTIRYQQLYGCYDNRPPLRRFSITIDPKQSQQLIQVLTMFANKNDFKYKIAYYGRTGEDFSFWMERKDLEVITTSPFTRGEFNIGFYNHDCVHPTLDSDIENLVNDLKNYLGEIPDITITEET